MTYEQHPNDRHMEVKKWWSYCYNGRTKEWMGDSSVGEIHNGVFHPYKTELEPVESHNFKCALYAEKFIIGGEDYGWIGGHLYYHSERVGEHTGVRADDGCPECKSNQAIR